MYIEYDINDHLFEDKIIEQKRFYKKEVPNVLLTVGDRYIYLDNITNYYEEYNSTYGWKVVMTIKGISLKDYFHLTQLFNRYTIQTDEIYRNGSTGKDERFLSPKKIFNCFSIKHKVSVEGETATYYITLWNKPFNIIHENTKLENAEL